MHAGDTSARLEGTAGTLGLRENAPSPSPDSQTSEGRKHTAEGGQRKGLGGMREKDGESAPGFAQPLEQAGKELQEFSQGRHPDRAAIISKTHSSVSLS